MGNIPFRQTRFWENCEKRIFDGVGKYDIPEIQGMYDVDEISDFIGWNYALKEKHPEDKAVHFFVDDYQFNRLWTNPDAYLEKLRRFQYVFTPDFPRMQTFQKLCRCSTTSASTGSAHIYRRTVCA